MLLEIGAASFVIGNLLDAIFTDILFKKNPAAVDLNPIVNFAHKHLGLFGVYGLKLALFAFALGLWIWNEHPPIAFSHNGFGTLLLVESAAGWFGAVWNGRQLK